MITNKITPEEETPALPMRSLYCIACRTPQRMPKGGNFLQHRLECPQCGMVTIHRNAESVFDVEELRAATLAMLNAMEMQEGRELEELHIPQREARHIWDKAKSKARAALSLVDAPKTKETQS